MKKVILFLSISILAISLISCKEDKKEVDILNDTTTELNEIQTELNEIQTELNIEAVDYKIINIEDKSRKALGNKSLSQYEKPELESLPINKKILYKIVLSKNVKENNIKPTVESIINNLISQDSDIDEIILWLYSDKEMANSGFDIGEVIWAPFGKLGNIDAKIAKSNNRDNYKIDYKIKKNLDQYLALKLDMSDKFGFTVEERKQIYKDLIKGEDNAFRYNHSEQDKMLKINKNKILKKYNITAEQLEEISTEAYDKNWPMD